MKNVNLFPIVVPGYVYEDGSSEPSYVESGATLLDFFAANAPDIPQWFEPEMPNVKPEWPETPDSWPDIIRSNISEFSSADDFINWMNEVCPNIEIASELKESIEEYYKIIIERKKWGQEYWVARAVQWRWYYAQQMLKGRPDEA